MKKKLLALGLSCLLLWTCGCSGREIGVSEPTASPEYTPTCGPGVPYRTAFRIVETLEGGTLLLAELEREDLIPSGIDICYVNPEGLEIWLDGEKADASALEDGMAIEITWDGTVLTTYPAQMGKIYTIEAWSLGSEKNPGGGYYDLCGLYLQVLDDLWEKDAGLNSGAIFAGVDLSRAPGDLSENEKRAIVWHFAGKHGVQPLEGTWEQLKAQGYFDVALEGEKSTLYEWKNGVHFTIEPVEEGEVEVFSLPVLKFEAHKWRSPLGAYWLSDCSAVWPQMGSWSEYTIGSEAIA